MKNNSTPSSPTQPLLSSSAILHPGGKKMKWLLLLLLSLMPFMTSTGMAQSAPSMYIVEHKLTVDFGINTALPDRATVWARCKGKGPVVIYSRLVCEVIAYDADGKEVDVINGLPIGNGGARYTRSWSVGPKSGTTSVELNGTTDNNTFKYLNGPSGNIKTIVRRWSLQSEGTNGTKPAVNPVHQEKSHPVNRKP